ncbi:hemerythrin domain-containing protein [Pseudonocardia sp. T1-2H]|uniref:hemerythrin domain-containing protein n=1 Tax=Pseudonocardia sp. T1-2H TaxID=3128899 RepID=UPI003100C878
MSTDAIVLLKDDHKQIRKLFRDFENAGENALKTKGRIVEAIIETLTVHTYLENECMYPEVRKRVPELEDDVLESYEEHHVADVLCVELAAMKPDDERFDAKTTVLIENVSHHIEEEEDEWFPQVREALGRKELPGNRRPDAGDAQGRAAPALAAERPQEDDRRRPRLITPADDAS